MTAVIHIPFYPSDWLAGTRGLSAEETGVYITLICRMYELAGPVERDDKRLHRLCGTKSKAAFARALDTLLDDGKITDGEGGLWNDRVGQELEKLFKKSTKSRQAAQARWNRKRSKNNGTSMRTHTPGICPGDASHKSYKIGRAHV